MADVLVQLELKGIGAFAFPGERDLPRQQQPLFLQSKSAGGECRAIAILLRLAPENHSCLR